MKVNLASGELYLPGYINIDNQSHYGHARVDLIADVYELDLPENILEEVVVSHFAMYIMGGPDDKDNPNQMRQLITRWHKWLKPEGKLIMETGNLKYIAKFILECEDAKELQSGKGIKQLFGFGNTYGHKWAWCPEILKPMFEEVGFKNVTVKPGVFHSKERDFLIVGEK